MNTLDFLLQLAIILLAAKFLGLLMKKLGLPQVLGFILAGVLIGPSIWGAIFGNETFEGWLFPIQNTADSRSAPSPRSAWCWSCFPPGWKPT